MKLGIPTLCRYDLLDELLRSAERGSMRPTGYIIIDNGGGYDRARLNAILGARSCFAELISPGHNLGVAASWNRILDLTAHEDGVVISNDDIELGEKTFEEMIKALSGQVVLGPAFVEGDGWALFGQSSVLTRIVGPYDEHFWPAYYEDVDYDARMTHLGVPRICPLTEPVRHHHQATATGLGGPAWLTSARERNRVRFSKKWGGPTRNPRWGGQPDTFQYEQPFNGDRPRYELRHVHDPQETVMRWDVVNYIAEKIKAKRYLEIGVAHGENIAKIRVAEKWGIDPAPTLPAVMNSTVFVPSTSLKFLRDIAPDVGLFDLVFIDGDHRAEVVYEEVHELLPYLSPGAAIVLHDCSPHTEAMQLVPPGPNSEWTGDVWKAIVRLRSEGHVAAVVNADYGVGIILPSEDSPDQTSAFDRELTYADLEQHREEWLGLLAPNEWKEWLDQRLNGQS